VYPYELGDPDFSWLLSTFQEAHPDYKMIDGGNMPLVLVAFPDSRGLDLSSTPTPQPTDVADGEDVDLPEKP